MEKVKGCWGCKHFIYTNSGEDISEVTPGSRLGMHCLRDKWVFDADFTMQEGFARILQYGAKCDEWEMQQETVGSLIPVEEQTVEQRLATLEYIVRDMIGNVGKKKE